LTSNDIVDALSETFETAFIQLSPETADLELRRRNKGRYAFYTNDELKERLAYIDSKGNLRVQLYFGYFLAFETPETVLRTIEFIMELILEYPDLLEVAYLPFSTDPASLLYLDPDKYDINCRVHSFRDYLRSIEDTYLTKSVSAPDMRLFEPRGIAGQVALDLERQIELFNYLFRSYRRSISCILREERSPATILELLRYSHISATSDASEKVKEAILDACRGSALLDTRLIETVEMECRMQKRPRREGFNARPEIWFADEAATGS